MQMLRTNLLPPYPVYLSTKLHSCTHQKIVICTVVALRTSSEQLFPQCLELAPRTSLSPVIFHTARIHLEHSLMLVLYILLLVLKPQFMGGKLFFLISSAK
jgi:hypothetical protein